MDLTGLALAASACKLNYSFIQNILMHLFGALPWLQNPFALVIHGSELSTLSRVFCPNNYCKIEIFHNMNYCCQACMKSQGDLDLD